jgi:hypothetical protein
MDFRLRLKTGAVLFVVIAGTLTLLKAQQPTDEIRIQVKDP